MKKVFLIVFLALISLPVFSDNLPLSLCGIWEGKDRFVFFEELNDSENSNQKSNLLETEKKHQIVVVLKEYYGWYYDRAAEGEDDISKEKRIRNSATAKKPEIIPFSLNQIHLSNVPDVFELEMDYTKRDINYIPIAVLDGKMYLDFYIKDIISEQENNQGTAPITEQGTDPIDLISSASIDYDGFWRGNAVSEGIKICVQNVKDNLCCYYIFNNQIFNIRYWKSDMDYTSDKAYFIWDNQEYNLDKHIISGTEVYSCTNGRAKKIRNLVAPVTFKAENFLFNEDKTLMIQDKEPYLVKIADKQSFEELMAMVKEANARRKPDPDPLFPEEQLDWHWDMIDYLESGNTLIQAVRQRQKAFGVRGKDLGK